MNRLTRFPAKLLLFGEYSILLGSSALSIPFDHFGANLQFIDQETGESRKHAVESNLQIRRMCDYFSGNPIMFDHFLDLRRLDQDLSNGLYFASTIPERYGFGGSGALCAAVFYGYRLNYAASGNGVDTMNIASIRQFLIMMESFFHGRSSGFDPLVSLLKTPLLLGEDGVITAINFTGQQISEKGMHMLLIDTGQPCSTGSLVTHFLAKFAADGLVNSNGKKMSLLVNSCISNLMNFEMNCFCREIEALSKLQLEYLNYLVPGSFSTLWADGLQTGLFTLKLCGSGGGGFLLCFTRKKDAAISYFSELNIPVISCFPSYPFS